MVSKSGDPLAFDLRERSIAVRPPIAPGLRTLSCRAVWACVLAAASGTTLAQENAASRSASDIRDTAGIFSAGAIEKAKTQLVKIERDSRIPTIIETIDSLGGDTIDAAARRHASRSAGRGIFILIAARDAKLEVLASREFEDVVDRSQRQVIRDAFIAEFRHKKFNEGLEQGVQAIARVAAKADVPSIKRPQLARPEGIAYPSPGQGAAASALVLRHQVRLSLAGARRVLAGSEAKAAAMGLKVNIAVVDDGGHLLTFARMDGARPASGYTALTKAITAATFRQPTGPVPPGAATPDVLLNLSLQNAAAASGGKITTLYGGVPIVVEEQVIGGVGVGGGTGEQDATIARAGIADFLADLPAESSPAKGDSSAK
jgi:glc operon protein GlcG